MKSHRTRNEIETNVNKISIGYRTWLEALFFVSCLLFLVSCLKLNYYLQSWKSRFTVYSRHLKDCGRLDISLSIGYISCSTVRKWWLTIHVNPAKIVWYFSHFSIFECRKLSLSPDIGFVLRSLLLCFIFPLNSQSSTILLSIYSSDFGINVYYQSLPSMEKEKIEKIYSNNVNDSIQTKVCNMQSI